MGTRIASAMSSGVSDDWWVSVVLRQTYYCGPTCHSVCSVGGRRQRGEGGGEGEREREGGEQKNIIALQC